MFADNAPRSLTAACYYWDNDGKETSQKFNLPVSYLTESPRIGIENRGPITRELAFKGVPLSDTDPDEIQIELLLYARTLHKCRRGMLYSIHTVDLVHSKRALLQACLQTPNVCLNQDLQDYRIIRIRV